VQGKKFGIFAIIYFSHDLLSQEPIWAFARNRSPILAT